MKIRNKGTEMKKEGKKKMERGFAKYALQSQNNKRHEGMKEKTRSLETLLTSTTCNYAVNL